MSAKSLVSVLVLCTVCCVTWAEPGVHTLRIRFPGPSSDKVVLPLPAKQSMAPYPAAGFRPEPAFELPEPTYLPPVEPEVSYGPPEEQSIAPYPAAGFRPEPAFELPEPTYLPPVEPELSYGPPEQPELAYGPPAEVIETPAAPQAAYGPPSDTYEPPELFYGAPEINEFPSAAIVNAPLTHASQFALPRPNKPANFRPVTRPKPAKPQKPVNHLTLPSTKRFNVFRPRRPQVLSQDLYPKTHLTLPRVERGMEFRPRRIPTHHQQQHQQHQQTNFFSRPLPASIFGNSNKVQSGRQLPTNIFSN